MVVELRIDGNTGIAAEVGQGMNKRAHEVDVSLTLPISAASTNGHAVHFQVADYDRTHAVNSRGVWLCSKYALAQMLAQEPREPNARGDRTRGWIVNAASILGLVAYPFVSCYTPGEHSETLFFA